jgi:two-component system sensor histidine kinase YesM
MAEQMENLIAQNRREQENLKKAELRTLQAQVNPHFLYNTLDTIVWAAESGKDEEVVTLTKSLSDFFRSSLSSGADWVTVAQEVRHLNGYLSIQKIRYRDILNYEVDVDPAMENCRMLKLLLQPLVENALYHGIKFRRGGGRILVRGRQKDNVLFFSVQDTGVGMTPEKLREVLDAMHTGKVRRRNPDEPEPGGGFGLYNVDQRIRLYYGLEKGIEIESGPDGTIVSFSVPAYEGEDALQ